MPKSTFMNLPSERKKEILDVCKSEFLEKCLGEASVSDIVEGLQIARGSFYKYFENLEECYFYILSEETIEIHNIFTGLLKENNFNVLLCLEKYGEKIAEEIYKKDNHALYRNKFLSWTPVIQQKWQAYCKKEGIWKSSVENIMGFSDLEDSVETIHCIKAVIHSLIQRIFIENLSEEVFLEKYKQQIQIIISGIPEIKLFSSLK